MNQIELLNSTLYKDISEWRADIADARYRTDELFRNSVESKLKRSQPTITGMQPAPVNKQTLVCQTFPDGTHATGTPDYAAAARVDEQNRAIAARDAAKASTQKYVGVQVKNHR